MTLQGCTKYLTYIECFCSGWIPYDNHQNPQLRHHSQFPRSCTSLKVSLTLSITVFAHGLLNCFWHCVCKGQWSWWRVWNTSLMRNSWGRWCCPVWRKGGSEETLLLSTTTWKEVEDSKMEVCLFSQVTCHRTSNVPKVPRQALGWILGKI